MVVPLLRNASQHAIAEEGGDDQGAVAAIGEAVRAPPVNPRGVEAQTIEEGLRRLEIYPSHLVLQEFNLAQNALRGRM
jgi:hypothetical protein